MALLLGIVLVGLMGLFHHAGLRAIDTLTSPERNSPHVTIVSAFLGLLALHAVEILLYAGAYAVLLETGWFGTFVGGFDRSWEGLIYFSGINFTTVGYTEIETSGSIRLVAMMQSLGGFMVLTWSATFLYSIWGKVFR